VVNIFSTISTKFYQNRPDFVDDVTKTFGVFGGMAVPMLFTYKTQHYVSQGGVATLFR